MKVNSKICKILVCIPVHNEAKTTGAIIDSAKKYATEVVVYDYVSKNNTTRIPKKEGQQLETLLTLDMAHP